MQKYKLSIMHIQTPVTVISLSPMLRRENRGKC